MDRTAARNLFIYQRPGKLAWKHEALSEAYVALVDRIYEIIPTDWHERQLAIRALHESKMLASAAVAVNEHPNEVNGG